MKSRIAVALALVAGALTVPSTASASMPLTNSTEITAFQARYGLPQTGALDAATRACAWARECPPLPVAPDAVTTSSDPAICSDGILSNDAGQNCSDGLYERTYGTAHATSSRTASGVGTEASLSSGGYGAPPASIAECESGSDPTTNTGNGFYGKWQFTTQTWQSVTGLPGNASDYSEAVQDAAAAKLYAGGAGAGNWPVCSR